MAYSPEAGGNSKDNDGEEPYFPGPFDEDGDLDAFLLDPGEPYEGYKEEIRRIYEEDVKTRLSTQPLDSDGSGSGGSEDRGGAQQDPEGDPPRPDT